MNQLGYTEFVAQGGDWATRHRAGGSVEASGLLGIHTNMPLTVPADISKAIQIDDPPPSGLSADDEKAYEVVVHFFKTAVGYANEMANRRRRTTALLIPVGLAGWMLDHDVRSYELIRPSSMSRAHKSTKAATSPSGAAQNVLSRWHRSALATQTGPASSATAT